jgi:hypothetical protein
MQYKYTKTHGNEVYKREARVHHWFTVCATQTAGEEGVLTLIRSMLLLLLLLLLLAPVVSASCSRPVRGCRGWQRWGYLCKNSMSWHMRTQKQHKITYAHRKTAHDNKYTQKQTYKLVYTIWKITNYYPLKLKRLIKEHRKCNII